jgi:predicted aspartyl protease
VDEAGVPRAVLLASVLVLAAGCGSGSSTSKGSVTVPIRVLQHGHDVLALVSVRIDGHGPFTFALDTGASRSLVDAQVARELGVRRSGTAEPVAGVGTVRRDLPVRVRSWSVGGVALPATTILEANLPFGNAAGGVQGLLGSDMLSRFDVVTIDYGRQELRLHRRAAATPG